MERPLKDLHPTKSPLVGCFLFDFLHLFLLLGGTHPRVRSLARRTLHPPPEAVWGSLSPAVMTWTLRLSRKIDFSPKNLGKYMEIPHICTEN